MKYADGTQVHFKPGTEKTVFHGEKGTLNLSRNDYRTEPRSLLPPPDPAEQEKWKGNGHVARPHLQNWLDAMQSVATLNAPIEVGHRLGDGLSSGEYYAATGKKPAMGSRHERFIDDVEANDTIDRPRRSGFKLPTV